MTYPLKNLLCSFDTIIMSNIRFHEFLIYFRHVFQFLKTCIGIGMILNKPVTKIAKFVENRGKKIVKLTADENSLENGRVMQTSRFKKQPSRNSAFAEIEKQNFL